MSKKYLDTKEGSLEQSVLGVWQVAAEEQSSRPDGRTRSYKEHRAKLEAARLRRENKKTVSEASGDKEAYKKFFDAAMKKFGISSPAELKGDKEKEFYDYIDKNWEGDHEEGLEASPNAANSQQLCAKNVVHEEWGNGECIPTMHAIPDEDGNVAWYDVMFEHGIEKGVVISELKVTRSEAHENHNKKNGKMLKAKKHHAESYEFGTDEYRKHTQKVTPGQDITDYQNFKVNSMKEALAKVWGLDEEVELDEATGKEIAAKMMKSKTMKAFAPKVAKMKSVTADDLEKMLPDYVAGGDIAKLFAGYMSSSYKEGKTATGEKRDEIDLNPKIGEKKER